MGPNGTLAPRFRGRVITVDFRGIRQVHDCGCRHRSSQAAAVHGQQLARGLMPNTRANRSHFLWVHTYVARVDGLNDDGTDQCVDYTVELGFPSL